ncbi:DUF3052 domain-containing protein [Maribellus comscasis]|uniref:DUF3052 domain-containing protein n=1 Tax=Maribellus comscasis TaxID=2681766 RepID=A0A6I6KB10_9BACT|nr:DUF3052 domain-containing protein [Maribellus comscasis]QGY47384.1 DUF3052 domain-containing protein [Maribellus comscasis]
MKTAGYSGTPLAKKLGIKNGFKIKIVSAPNNYFSLFADLPTDIKEINDTEIKKNFIHFFVRSQLELESSIAQLKKELAQNGMLWISWPKKSAKTGSDLDGNIVRETGIKNGFVDIKVCAVSEIWSGLKFVIPRNKRK